jgi:hypothetical protein
MCTQHLESNPDSIKPFCKPRCYVSLTSITKISIWSRFKRGTEQTDRKRTRSPRRTPPQTSPVYGDVRADIAVPVSSSFLQLATGIADLLASGIPLSDQPTPSGLLTTVRPSTRDCRSQSESLTKIWCSTPEPAETGVSITLTPDTPSGLRCHIQPVRLSSGALLNRRCEVRSGLLFDVALEVKHSERPRDLCFCVDCSAGLLDDQRMARSRLLAATVCALRQIVVPAAPGLPPLFNCHAAASLSSDAAAGQQLSARHTTGADPRCRARVWLILLAQAIASGGRHGGLWLCRNGSCAQ